MARGPRDNVTARRIRDRGATQPYERAPFSSTPLESTPGSEGARAAIGAQAETDALTDDYVLRFIRECRREADQARRDRLQKSRRNQMAFMDTQDFSHKQPGQSAEFLPKISTAAEQFYAVIKK